MLLQVILGSQALGDGTFDRDTDFTAFLEDGSWSVPLSSILNSTGDVLYVVPAAKSEGLASLPRLTCLKPELLLTCISSK